jgi:hypothetical protein
MIQTNETVRTLNEAVASRERDEAYAAVYNLHRQLRDGAADPDWSKVAPATMKFLVRCGARMAALLEVK